MQGFQMSKQSRRKRSMSYADIPGGLPVYNPTSSVGRRESQSSSSIPAMNYKLIHLIPIVVILCFFILWCFITPVEIEIKDGRTIFVPVTKKSPRESEPTDVDLTVLALESQPDGFSSLFDSPYASVALHNQSNVSLLDSHGHNASSTDSHVPNSPLSVSHELKAPFSGSHERNASLSVTNDKRILYTGTSNEAAPQPSGKA